MTRSLTHFIANRFIIGCFVTLACTTAVHAASFDCAKASSSVERAVCGNEDLSRLDDALAELYKTVISDSDAPARRTIRLAQLRWLEVRNTCSESSCIQDAYQTRLTELGGESQCPLTRCSEFAHSGAEEELWESAQNNNVAGVVAALTKGANSNVCGPDYRRPLHVAVLNRNSSAVRALIKAKANPNVHDCPGDTPLVFAASGNDVAIALHLLVAGANVEAGLRHTPLQTAASHGHVGVLRILLKHKADPNALHGYFSPLMLAVMNRHVAAVQLLLEAGANASYRTKDDGTAIFAALGNFRAVPFRTDEEARKALEIVTLLVKHGADVNARTTGWSPLQYARVIKATAIAEFLASVGAKP